MTGRGRILFADNDAMFRSIRAEFLLDDYEVFEASDVQEARQHLQESRIHLAICDIRLGNDNDEYDLSGLLLAQDATYRAVPKILLTGYPSLETLRDALRDALTGLPSVVDYLAKSEGGPALVQAVERAFATHVRLNTHLRITTEARQPLAPLSLMTLLAPTLERHQLQQRAEELEDVWRRVFPTQDHLRLEQLLWQREGRVAVRVLAFQEGVVPEALVLVCGSSAAMAVEAQRYAEVVPQTLASGGTLRWAQAETVHFAAQAYALADGDLEHTQSLKEVYQRASEKGLNAALEHLVQQTLRAWHQDKRLRVEPALFDTLYRERLGWTTAPAGAEGHAIVQALAQQLPTLGLVVEATPQTLRLRLGEHVWSGANPLLVLDHPIPLPQPVLAFNTPGTLTGENILVDARGRTWLTDFAQAGLVPQVWNLVALEAMLRFDWLEAPDLSAVYDLERCLVGPTSRQLNAHDVAPALRPALRAIQSVRRLAAPLLSIDPMQYHYGLLYQALHRLLACPPAGPWSPGALGRYGHLLLAAAWLYSRLQGEAQGHAKLAVPVGAGLSIDTANRSVWSDGVRVEVPRQSYELLAYMYARAGQLCTRQQLVEEVLGLVYDEADTAQVNRLNAAIRRLRERIEADPAQPRYLRLEAGYGYRLVCQ